MLERVKDRMTRCCRSKIIRMREDRINMLRMTMRIPARTNLATRAYLTRVARTQMSMQDRVSKIRVRLRMTSIIRSKEIPLLKVTLARIS